MKGNEKDCICHKPNGKHTESCDAYRLSEFMKKAATMNPTTDKTKRKDYYTSLHPGSFLYERIKNERNECWLWTGTITEYGYSSAMVSPPSKKKVRVHKYIYELANGKIPKGLVLDHLCRNRACVNPEHLEPVTPKVNILRGEGIAARNAKKTSCSKGHPFDKRNLKIEPRVKNGRNYKRRICLICEKERNKRFYRNKNKNNKK